MSTRFRTAGGLAALCAALSLAAIIISPAGAVSTAANGTGWNSTHGTGAGFHHTWNATAQQERMQALIAALDQKGVDTSPLAAAVQNNDTAAIRSWMDANRQYLPAMNRTAACDGLRGAGNKTARQQGLKQFMTTLGQKGIDTGPLAAAIQNNDTSTIHSWLETYAPQGRNWSANSTRTADPAAILAKLSADGADTSVPQADLQSGNTTGAQAWIKSYFAEHRPVDATGFAKRHSFTNSTVQRS